MRVLALSWDAASPGHLDGYALRLAQALNDGGADVALVAAATGPTSTQELGGVAVTWVAEAPPVLPADPDYDLSRVLALSSRTFAAAERIQRDDPADVVLALGWQTAYAAANLHATHGVPVVAALRTTEIGRGGGSLGADHARLVHQVEWWLTDEARRVVTDSRSVRHELAHAFRLPPAKLEVVPAGIDIPERPGSASPGVHLVAPPSGPRAAATTAAARALASLGLPVWLDQSARHPPASAKLARPCVVVVTDDCRADTALEAMAHGRAVVVADRGPLRELVQARRSGLRVGPDDPVAITAVVRSLVTDRVGRARLGRGAVDRVRQRHDWSEVARAFLDISDRAITEERLLRDQQRERRPLRPVLLRSPILGLEQPD